MASMVQRKFAVFCSASSLLWQQAVSLRKTLEDATACSTLKNHGTYSTVDVKIGTHESLPTIVDTGSNAFLIESCHCEEQQLCEVDGSCFNGANSDSFDIAAEPTEFTMQYGSGPLDVAEASDDVTLGPITAHMQ